jgi:hemerythrin-like domain-containing protein
MSTAASRDDTCAEETWENEGGRIRSSATPEAVSSARGNAELRRSLAAEHALLLRAVIERAAAVLAALDDDRVPKHELSELVDYLQQEVISQTRIEEQILFAALRPSDAAISALRADHVMLRYALESLTDAARETRRPEESSLVATIIGLVADLADHLRRERAILCRHATPAASQQAVAAMAERPHAWYPLTHAPVIDVDALPPHQVVRAIRPRIRRLRPDERVELVSRTDLQHLSIDLLRGGDVAVKHLDDGPLSWRLAVTLRRKG